MNRRIKSCLQKLILLLLTLVFAVSLGCFQGVDALARSQEMIINLPQPKKTGDLSVEAAISERRSIRNYSSSPLSLKEVSQLLWSGQGITEKSTGKRASPSAGMTYPMELFLVVGPQGVKGLSRGIYNYRPKGHELKRIADESVQTQLSSAALDQSWVERAPIDIVVTGVYRRTTGKYGQRGVRYVHIEAGAVAENLYLQAETLGLGMVTVGAFRDERVLEILNLPEEHTPLLIIPVGHPK